MEKIEILRGEEEEKMSEVDKELERIYLNATEKQLNKYLQEQIKEKQLSKISAQSILDELNGEEA